MNKTGRFLARLLDYKVAVSNLGVLPALLYKFQKVRSRFLKKGEPLLLLSKYSDHPLWARAKTSDTDAFGQIFVAREYRCIDEVREASLVIDCGANVGYASAYFLSRFPNAYVIAVEPNKENFELLSKNLAPFKGRYRAICSAVWSKNVGLVLSEVPFGDGREWSCTVREVRRGEEPEMMACSVGTLLRESGFERIGVLKIDIEGAEVELFGSDEHKEWLPYVDNLLIELHGSQCESIFRSAISREGFELSRCDELTVGKRRQVR